MVCNSCIGLLNFGALILDLKNILRRMSQRDDFLLQESQSIRRELLLKGEPLHLLEQSLLEQMVINIEGSLRHLWA